MAAGFLPLGTQAALVEDASPYLTQQMLLGDELTFQLQGNVNYYFAEHAIATLAYADRVDTYRLEDLTPVGNGQHAIAAELAAAQMTEDIVLTIRVGEVVVLQETYSIRNYLSALLDGSYGDQTKQLSRELLNYGAWAQKYFKHRQNDLANAGYAIEPQYAIAEEMPGVELSGSVSGVKFYGTSVLFTSKTAIRYYFTGSAANCTFAVDGKEYTPVSKDGMYYIEVPEVNPQDMETPMQVEVTDGADTLSVRYVPLSYFVRSYQKATDETYRGLLQAAYSYFKTAASYTPEENEDLGQSGGTEQTPDVVPDSENLILGFESYGELTGAKLAVGNMLGRMEFNTDRNYITQGNASLKVSPQGDYNSQGSQPYFKLDLLDTTCKFSDFSDMKRISFDVYNGEKQTLHISASLVTGEDPEAYLTANKQTFTLAPNGWTTCYYDLSFMAGYNFYDLSKVRYMNFSFPEYKQSREDVPNTLYIDNLRADPYGQGEGPIQPDFDYAAGVDFETAGQDYLVTGQGIQNRDADIERIVYYSSGTVAAPAGGGSYGLRLSHESNYWPTFRLHFGQTLPAGTELSFMAYGRIYGKNLYNKSVFEFSSGGNATEEFACGQWTQLYLTLPKAAEYIDLFWNIDRANITSGSASGQVYIDNIQFVRSEPAGDILEGYGFEERGNAERFTGQGNSANDATIKRFTYESLGIGAPAGGGEYALKLTHSSSQTPTFRINFGKELAAGTTITFMAYAKRNSGYILPEKHVIQYSGGTNATASFNPKVWTTLTITLPEAAEYIDLTWNFKASFGTAVCELYIDNIKATEPEIESTGDFLEGIDFETSGHEKWFAGIGIPQDIAIEKVSYADANVTAPANSGSYALKVSHTSDCWPNFRVNFGKTLEAGTVITFDVYGNYDYAAPAGVNKYMKLELSADGKKVAESKDPNHVVWTLVETWQTATITLTADSDHVDLFYNVADGQQGNFPSWILLDNFKAEQPGDEDPSGEQFAQLDFEQAADAAFFVGQGKPQDATIERVSYADSGIAMPTDGGSYALKLSTTTNYWPTFRINFGKTLKAGTKITFMAYGKINGESLYNLSLFEYSSGGDATTQFACDAWTQLTITLKADAEYIDLFWNIDRASITSSTASGEVYVDNLKVTEP